jgi:hypothetical protein
MAGEYFDKIPEITYNKVLVRDISRRVAFLKQSVANPYLFLPYTIEEGDRAEDIAYHYYGDPNYAWLVYLANDIVDPYNEWPMDEYTFNQYIIEKYKDKSGGRTGYDVVTWAQDTTRTDNIIYYYKEV